MKKRIFIPAFLCIALMLTGCGAYNHSRYSNIDEEYMKTNNGETIRFNENDTDTEEIVLNTNYDLLFREDMFDFIKNIGYVTDIREDDSIITLHYSINRKDTIINYIDEALKDYKKYEIKDDTITMKELVDVDFNKNIHEILTLIQFRNKLTNTPSTNIAINFKKNYKSPILMVTY